MDSNHQAARAPEAHVEPSPDPRYVWSRKDSTEDYPRSQPDPALDAPIGVNSVDKRDEGGTAEQSLRSPPRLQPCRGQDGTRVAALADTTALNETGGNAETTLLRDHSEGHGGQSSRVAQEGHGGLAAGTVKQEQQGSASKGAAAATDTKFLAQQQPAGSGENMRRRKKHVAATVAQNLGSIHAASASDANNNCAVRDNWGSVFIVGGGRRRRRPAVRQRPSEIEETPAARRAQVRDIVVYILVESGSTRLYRRQPIFLVPHRTEQTCRHACAALGLSLVMRRNIIATHILAHHSSSFPRNWAVYPPNNFASACEF